MFEEFFLLLLVFADRISKGSDWKDRKCSIKKEEEKNCEKRDLQQYAAINGRRTCRRR